MSYRMRRFRYNKFGQASLYDAILFFIILIIASSILTVAVYRSSGTEDTMDDNTIIGYTEGTFAAIMECTFYQTSYQTKDGDVVTLKNKTIPYLLLFDIVSRRNDDTGGTTDVASLEDGVERPIAGLVERLIENQFYYILKVYYDNSEILDIRDDRISPAFQPEEYTTAEGDFGWHGVLDREAVFRLAIWRA